MKILIDIGHPGHVHYFKNFIFEMKRRGHEFIITARDKEVTFDLLEKFNIPYINRGVGKNSALGKLIYMLKADLKLLSIALKFKPDIYLSFGSPYPAQVSYLLGKPHISLTDTEHALKVQSKFVNPFNSVVITPKSFLENLGSKHIRINCVIEYFYLMRKYFKPSKEIRNYLGVSKDEDYVVLRFVSWNAFHDFGHKGLDIESKLNLIKLLETRFRVFISTEGDLPDQFEKYRMNISPDKMHDVLSEASLFIGESATMSSESVMLGTYAVYINSLPLMGYLLEEQEAGLLKHFNSFEGVLPFIKEKISEPNLKLSSIEKSEELKSTYINPTEFLVWFFENYPKSKTTILNDPEFQNRFM